MAINENVHAHLLAAGYQHTHFENTYEDIGDAESGPQLTGSPEFDEYESADDRIIFDADGHFAHFEFRDLLQEEAEKMMCP